MKGKEGRKNVSAREKGNVTKKRRIGDGARREWEWKNVVRGSMMEHESVSMNRARVRVTSGRGVTLEEETEYETKSNY